MLLTGASSHTVSAVEISFIETQDRGSGLTNATRGLKRPYWCHTCSEKPEVAFLSTWLDSLPPLPKASNAEPDLLQWPFCEFVRPPCA